MGFRKLSSKQKKEKRFYGKVVMSGLVGIVLCGLAYKSSTEVKTTEEIEIEQAGGSRRLSGGGCEAYGTSMWAVPLFALGILWLFDGLAVVCDDFFQPSLEAISDALQLSPDVAGATFLAAGSSAPELFTSIGDAFGPGNNIGMGTIVGSAMFNILVIVALSAFVAARSGANLLIDWKPVTRDVAYYSTSIIILAIFFMDGNVYWWESLIMVIVYGTYILFMMHNQTILSKCGTSYKVSPDEDEKRSALELQTQKSLLNDIEEGDKLGVEDGVNDPDAGAGQSIKQEDKEDEEEDDDDDMFEFPEDTMGKVIHCLSLPFLFAFYYTIPQVGKEKWKEWYWFAFIMSILWIGVLCHFMVDFATRIACALHISPVVMGVLVLAVGTSVPDAIGSMIAAREGEADMAIANAVGSNVFDVLLGLGFPWCLKSLTDSLKPIEVDRDGIIVSVGILFGTVFLFVGVLVYNKWNMNKKVGVGLFGFYICYVLYTIISAAVGF